MVQEAVVDGGLWRDKALGAFSVAVGLTVYRGGNYRPEGRGGAAEDQGNSAKGAPPLATHRCAAPR